MNADDSVIEKGDPGQNTGQTGDSLGADGQTQNQQSSQELSEQELQEQYEQKGLEESEKMAEKVDEKTAIYGIQDQVEVSFNAQYVIITLNGAVLFDPGSEVIKEDALPLVDKVGRILDHYTGNIIEVEGHTDNVQLHTAKYENNDVLSMFRALHVANYIKAADPELNPAYVKYSGRGEYEPIADNSTAEGRARNRRVEIRIYNSFNSNLK